MIRIGVDAHVLTGKFQGSRTYLLNLLRHLGRIDACNRYILYSFDPAVTKALLPFDNFQHVLLRVRPALPRLLVYWPWEQWRRRLDVLLTSYFTPLLYSRRQLVIVHDLLFESHPQYFTRFAALRFRLLVRLSAARARKVLAVSETTRNELRRLYRIPDEKIALVRGGIEPRPPVEREQGSKMILSVGRLEPRKNIATLLRAFGMLQTPDVRLVVIGREDFGAEDVASALHALQEDRRFSRRVTWFAGVPDAELPRFYGKASVFAFPSFAEGFGLPVLEALAHGTPVVASGHAAMREIGGDMVRYFDADAPDSDWQMALLLDEAITRGMPGPPGACAAHVQSWNWDRSAQAFHDLITDLFTKPDTKIAEPN